MSSSKKCCREEGSKGVLVFCPGPQCANARAQAWTPPPKAKPVFRAVSTHLRFQAESKIPLEFRQKKKKS